MKGLIKVLAILLVNSLVFSGTVFASDSSIPDTEYCEENEAEVMEEADVTEVAEEDEPEVEEIKDPLSLEIFEEYQEILANLRPMANVGTYEEELAKFPASYQTYLKNLHTKHPKWIFVAIDTKLAWNEVVKQESVSASSKGTNRSLLEKTADGLLLSKKSTDYNASSASYIAKDGSTWVSASRPAVAYYMDPRNFLVDQYVLMFQALDYNAKYHTLDGVENILKGTDLWNKPVEYIDTSGKKNTSLKSMTYGQIILAAGIKYKVNPLFLAARIRQETGGKLTNGSISGNYSYGGKKYTGYYNFFNIGAYSSSTGSAVANGLVYASKVNGSYGRAWTSPLLAIDGGANFLSSSYISKGQNTLYFEKFNTIVKPYYDHQYMQNLTAAASEAKTTYNSYVNLGIMENGMVFYIPTYQSMPKQESGIQISKTQKTAKATNQITLRKGPATSYGSVATIAKGQTVTVNSIKYTDPTESVSNQEKYAYWAYVTYESNKGYVPARQLSMNPDFTVAVSGTKKLAVSGVTSGEAVYYETENPGIAKVSEDGTITGVKSGTCNVYAVTSSAKKIDMVGVKVSGTVSVAAPKLSKIYNTTSGITICWEKSSNAQGYYIYRKTGSGSYKKIKTISSGGTLKYTDKSAKTAKTYVYTVKAYNGKKVSGYNKTGFKQKRLKKPTVSSVKMSGIKVKVKWKKVTGAKGYEIYRKTDDGDYEKIGVVKSAKKLTYSDAKAESQTKYYYAIRAYSGSSKSTTSSAKSIITK